ncbi:MAG TPA: DUF2141 domain-containing protein [Myxococcales bacterium]|nr:DUF2141 domain-containing protein [Myxococcales bacterium]
MSRAPSLLRRLAACAGLVAWSAAGPARAAGFEVVVHVEGPKGEKGTAVCALYASKDGFPGDEAKALRRTTAPIDGSPATCVFEDLPPGTYAVAAFEDENGNGKCDRNFLGIPKEPVGVSNDAKGTFGPPPFDKARFQLTAKLSMTIHLARP